jgi:hypothetical protein
MEASHDLTHVPESMSGASALCFSSGKGTKHGEAKDRRLASELTNVGPGDGITLNAQWIAVLDLVRVPMYGRWP